MKQSRPKEDDHDFIKKMVEDAINNEGAGRLFYLDNMGATIGFRQLIKRLAKDHIRESAEDFIQLKNSFTFFFNDNARRSKRGDALRGAGNNSIVFLLGGGVESRINALEWVLGNAGIGQKHLKEKF